MFGSRFLRAIAFAVLFAAAFSTFGHYGFAYQPAYQPVAGITLSLSAANETTTTETMTLTNRTTTTEASTSNQTVTSTVTTSMFNNSDLTTSVLAVVAVAALVIAVYALVKRPRARAAGPAASVTRVIICPTCGTSNKPGAAFCRKCRTQLR